MATKPVTVSPPAAAAAGCTATCESYYTGTQQPSSQGAIDSYTNFQVIARGRIGTWKPKRIKVSHFYTYSDGSTSTDTITYRSSNYGDPNPWNFPAVKNFTDHENPFEFEEIDPGTEWRLRTVKDEITGIEVEFEGGYTPTHLLVNSSTAENPAKLVYDPATNLLVADY